MLHPGRMLADGIPYADIEEARRQIGEDGFEWFDFWDGRADAYQEIAERAIAGGHAITGGEMLWQASLSAHYAQFMYFDRPELREAGQRRKVELYDRAAPLFEPAGERIEIEVEGATMPGYLRLPPGEGPHACAVLIGGLESTKEESYLFENICLRRGIATYAFDGPGQGEMYFEVKLRGDFERYTSAALDHLVARPEIDASRVGVLGRSLGSNFAARAAAGDDRFRACVAWGGCFDMEDFEAMPKGTQDGFVYVTGIEDTAQAVEHLRAALDLSAVAGEIRCPLLVLNGRHDQIFSIRHLEEFERAVTNAPIEIVLEEEGDHCCHNMGHIVRPRMADWLAAKLGVQVS